MAKKSIRKEPTDKQVKAAMEVLAVRLAYAIKNDGIARNDEIDDAEEQEAEYAGECMDRFHETWFCPDEVNSMAITLLDNGVIGRPQKI